MEKYKTALEIILSLINKEGYTDKEVIRTICETVLIEGEDDAENRKRMC